MMIRFETSKGPVVARFDEGRDFASAVVVDGRAHLDDIYEWTAVIVDVRKGWVYVELRDSWYGQPEYRYEQLRDEDEGKARPHE